MPVRPGSTFGSYEILERIGAGGMGEVFRARDPRLAREIAIKILPGELAGHRDRLQRFEQEARSASQLNHPNIVTIYEIGAADGVSYIAMELIDGRSLRELLATGPLTLRKMVQFAAQVADGLAAAHERGIVHRDIKPENIMITRAGLAKILDFGLAKLAGPIEADATIRRDQTQPGAVLGTVGYMSPEQAAGHPADSRSDQFSLGSTMYEMVTGHRPFQKATSAETLTAILREDPAPIGPQIPLPLRWIVERCLAKEPDERYASTRDLAHDLQRLRDVVSDTAVSGVVDVRPPKRRWRWSIAIAIASLILAIAALAIAYRAVRREIPSFHRVTFRRGAILSARFAPDGHTIIYGAAWEGAPFRIFSVREENVESAPLALPDGDVLSISRSGELLVSIGRHYAEYFVTNGNLAQAALTGGGGAREMVENVECADWLPDGKELAVVRNVVGASVLEFPMGKVLYRTEGYANHIRVSPDGQKLAFIDHPIRGDDRGTIAILDRSGHRRTLTREFASAAGVAWRLDGKEIWFTAADSGVFSVLRAVTPAGRLRDLLRTPSRLVLQDIAADGRVLVTSAQERVGSILYRPDEKGEHDLSWLDASFLIALSSDGKKALLSEQGEGAGAAYGVYLRNTDGSPAVRISDGFGSNLSPDGRFALVTMYTKPQKLMMVPTGAGSPIVLAPGFDAFLSPVWSPDQKRIYFKSSRAGEPMRIYAAEIATGRATPISPPVGSGLFPMPITPDGKWIATVGPDQMLGTYPVDGGAPRAVPGATAGEIGLQFAPDGKSLYTARVGQSSPIYRVDLTTGSRTLWRRVAPSDPAGIIIASPSVISADGQSYGYIFIRDLGDLYVVHGVH